MISSNGNSVAQKRGFANEELEEELGKNTIAYQWRDYDPALGRFNKIDRFAEKYNRITPYHFTANNPIYFNEVKGDSINVKKIQDFDRDNGTNYTQKIIADLNSQTGLNFNVNGNGQLVYDTDSEGNPVISTTTDSEGNVTQNGSAEARKIMTHAVSTTDQAFVRINTNRNSGVATTGGNLINLNPNQIGSFISGVNNVDSRTQGWGMTLMHETQHSNVAEGGAVGHGAEARMYGRRGVVVDRMNIIRRELNLKGANYGARQSYKGLYLNPITKKPTFIPYGRRATRAIGDGKVPSSSTMYIQIN